MSKIEQLENEKIEIRDTFQLYCKVMEEATELENEVDALAKRIEEKAQLIAGYLMDRNWTFKEALKELEELSELANGNLIKYLRENAIEILEMTQVIIFKEMEQAKCRNIKEYTEGKEIKNTDGDTITKVNEDGIVVNGILKINQEQDQEIGVINYLPAKYIGNLAPELIEEITEEVIKKMKEFEEKANCEVEALRNEVNSLKAENSRLKEELKNDTVTQEVVKIINRLDGIPTDRAITKLNNLMEILSCISRVRK
ncbi:MAG: hypothetical protein NSGCLCUN01_04014 [uncultured Clostridium sp.]